MGNKTLRRKISLFILIPLILGTLVTALVSWLPIYLQYSSWINYVIDDMVNDQGTVLLEVSLHVSALTAGVLQIPTNFAMMIGMLIEEYYENEFTVTQKFTGANNYINAIQLVEGGDRGPLTNLSMWYLNQSVRDIDGLPTESYVNLIDSAVFDTFSRPVLTNFTNNRIVEFFHVFNDGLLYRSPAIALDIFVDYPGDKNCSPGYRTVGYDPRCSPFFAQVLENLDHYLAVLPDPYVSLQSNQTTNSACKGVWTGGPFQLVTCVDYTVDDLNEVMASLTVTGESYAFALNVDGTVFSHPNTCWNTSHIFSILELEFNNATGPDVAAFNNSIVPLFKTGSQTLSRYQKFGESWLIAVTPVYVMLAISQIYVHQLSVGVVMPERGLWTRFDPLQSESYKILIVEVLVFFGVMSGIVFAGWL